MNEVKIFYLIGGESIIAEVVKKEPTLYVLSHPYSAMAGPSGSAIISFCPFADTESEDITVYVHALACVPMKPKESVLSAYREMTGKIVLVEKSPLLH